MAVKAIKESVKRIFKKKDNSRDPNYIVLLSRYKKAFSIRQFIEINRKQFEFKNLLIKF